MKDQSILPTIEILPTFECAEIPSARLDLVSVTADSLRCQIGFGSNMRSDLGQILHAAVPDEWPGEHWEQHVVDYLLNLLAEHPDSQGWCRYLLLRPDPQAGDLADRVLIGTFGCSFPKPETGEAELGYGILSSWQRQGYAAEAVLAMMPWLRSQRPIHAFTAQTFPHLYGSIRVLEKCGFVPAGDGYEAGAVLFRKTLEASS